jgi:hypothetical protein
MFSVKQQNSARATTGGIGFSGMLTIAFIVLKLMNVIDWSWWWVLSPLWITFLLGLVITAIVLAIVIWIKKD